MRRLRDVAGALLWARELASHDRWPRSRLLQHQRRAFRRIARHAAARTPLYARLYEGLDLTRNFAPEDLPTVTKRLLMERFDETVADPRLTRAAVDTHLARMQGDALLFGRYRVVSTAGTSGYRGHFIYDRPAWRMVLANTLRWNRLAGLHLRLPTRPRIATIGADAPMHVSERIPRSGDVGLFRVRRFAATASTESLARELQAFRPDAILAYPSIAALIAEAQISGSLSIAPAVVSTHSEMLTQEMRARIRAAWGVHVFDHYGLTEEPHVAVECEAHEGLHVFEDASLVEVVDEAGRPMPDGTPGARWLLTNLYNHVQPLIRYEVTDVLTRTSAPCRCGRPFARLTAIGGRSEEALRLPAAQGAGTVAVPPLLLQEVVESFPDVLEYTLVHEPRGLRAAIVPRRGADAATLAPRVADALAETARRAGPEP